MLVNEPAIQKNKGNKQSLKPPATERINSGLVVDSERNASGRIVD